MLSITGIQQQAHLPHQTNLLWQALDDYTTAEEIPLAESLLAAIPLNEPAWNRATARAIRWIEAIRENRGAMTLFDHFMAEYNLSSQAGINLMMLAESLPRIPDQATADEVTALKLGASDWTPHSKHSHSTLVNASTRILEIASQFTVHTRENLLKKTSTSLLRSGTALAMKKLADHFVLGNHINTAINRSLPLMKQGQAFSFDMLGEAAQTREEADAFLAAYLQAVEALGNLADSNVESSPRPELSVKLSALHPRYEALQFPHIEPALYESLLKILVAARKAGIGVTLDAEESHRLKPQLKLVERAMQDPQLAGWEDLGIAVQAYSRRSMATLCLLQHLSEKHHHPLKIRLVKGAYWDSEIKRAQQLGTDSYPVFTHKSHTDIAYIACSAFLLAQGPSSLLKPAFATHNAMTLATLLELQSHYRYPHPLEFQRLHGMGSQIFQQLQEDRIPGRYRVYAPVGSFEELLPYLVRRLLENGANTSFVRQLFDPDSDTITLVTPLAVQDAHQLVTPPGEIYLPQRKNSRGLDPELAAPFPSGFQELALFRNTQWHAASLVATATSDHSEKVIASQAISMRFSPHNRQQKIGTVAWAHHEDIHRALDVAHGYSSRWRQWDAQERIEMLHRFARLLETRRGEFISLLQKEAGKTLPDALAEIRETLDFCYYYASQAESFMAHPETLPAIAGEQNRLLYSGKGVFLCISPWNFPLAIFCGQILAALVTGNCVMAKPASQTPLIAFRAAQLLHEAGIPPEALQLICASGRQVKQHLLPDHRIQGVAFTGSCRTAHIIHETLAARNGPIATLIAETGGQNCMIADSTALPEQLVRDVIQSAFHSAGQRCSALRVLYLQEEIALSVMKKLAGAMQQLRLGNPEDPAVDIGPVIDETAQHALLDHIGQLRDSGVHQVAEAPLPPDSQAGYFVAPVAFEIQSLNELSEEHFGPVLHIIRYRRETLPQIIEDINRYEFGLTLGIHSRNEATIELISRNCQVGNIYVNRPMTGAVVGSQPFGGMGMSGTGPKAGGPNYLKRFVNEKTIAVNTAAFGGAVELLQSPPPTGS